MVLRDQGPGGEHEVDIKEEDFEEFRRDAREALSEAARALLGWLSTLPGPILSETLVLMAPVFLCKECKYEFVASLPEGLDLQVIESERVQCPKCLKLSCTLTSGMVEAGRLLAEN